MGSEITMAACGTAAAPTPASHPHGSAGISTPRPTIIGIYGVPGCGKSFFLNQLSGYLDSEFKSSAIEFKFYDSSQVLADHVPGGLAAFRALGHEEKERVRETAIKRIQAECSKPGETAVIAGHYSFWDDEGNPEPERVMTSADRSTYTHIFYLSPPHDRVSRYRQGDMKRQRRHLSEDHLLKWMELERSELRRICYESGILFSVVYPKPNESHVHETALRIKRFSTPLEQQNKLATMEWLDDVLNPVGRDMGTSVETAIVLDADRTLGPGDAGVLFWKIAVEFVPDAEKDALKTLFGNAPDYSYNTFLQAMLLYDEITDDDVYLKILAEVAAELTLYPEVQTFLKEAVKHDHVVVIVATCGLANIWERVVGRAGIPWSRVRVIGARTTGDYGAVTPETKRDIVLALRERWGLKTWVFGDSPIDLPMLCVADHPVVVVGTEKLRSKTMEAALSEAVNNGLKAIQVLLPNTVSPRLDSTRLPEVALGAPEFTRPVFHQRADVVHATDKAASRLLMTPTRDAETSGPSLREAHHQVGRYLAMEFVADRIGTEDFAISHVQGSKTNGFRLKDEAKTLIVALMRAGEPMASGVNSAFPTAVFLHANRPSDLTAPRVNEASTILLVDGVVNGGTTMIKFIKHIRGVAPEAGVVVVAGVVQDRCVGRKGGNKFSRLLRDDEKLSVVALRISDNMYRGQGTVDTGNRLFNTTHLP